MALPRRLIALLLGVVCVLGWVGRPDGPTPGRDRVLGSDDAAVLVAGRVALDLAAPGDLDDDGAAPGSASPHVGDAGVRTASRHAVDAPAPPRLEGVTGRPRGPPAPA